jgi:hypothetical protein
MIKSTFYVSILLLISVFTRATIIEVPGNAESIQEGIDMAESGDTVLVSPGTYFENIRFNGKNIVVGSHFILENEPAYILSTIINGSQPQYADTASCVMFINGEDSTAVLAGFTLTGGTGTVWEDEHSPGYWFTEGGGILIQYSSPTIRNNLIIDNEAIAMPSGVTSAGGGAIRSGDSNPRILNNIIMNNQGRYGAGIVLNYSGAVIRNNIIAGNYGGEDYGGGGVWCLGNGDNPKLLDNNTLVNNHATNYGGGIRLWSTMVNITNCILWGNTAPNHPQIQGTTGIVTYSNVEGGYTGTGNIDDDPIFEGIQNMLGEESPCIDAGNPDPVYFDPEDPQAAGMALFPALGTVTNDMGAYGGPGADLFPEIITAVDEFHRVGEDDKLRIYPNPLPRKGVHLHVHTGRVLPESAAVFNSAGSLIRIWTPGTLGSSPFLLDASGLEGGIYLLNVVLENGKSYTEKLIVE